MRVLLEALPPDAVDLAGKPLAPTRWMAAAL
jgi:hypothetical protein